MRSWVHDFTAGSIFWLNGMAGTGKTTITYSLCAELDANHQLAASFFCSRSLPECRDVKLIIPSLAFQLAGFSLPFRSMLSRMLEKDQDVLTRPLPIQFESLIVKPLMDVQETLPNDLVVVIDALDECENKESTRQILEALVTKTSHLSVKFVVSSRPEPEIREGMEKRRSRRAKSRLVLHELDKGTVQQDIETYLRAELAPVNPSDSQIESLVQRAGILFIYAATVVRYISHDDFQSNPHFRLEAILNVSSTDKEIDELYTMVLKTALDDSHPNGMEIERDDIKRVLYAVICAQEPLTIGALSGLLGLYNIDQVRVALQPLASVLHVVETSGLVTALHASFPDYMLDPSRSKNYCCDAATQNHTLALRCFNCIKETEPQFNICGLESSYVPDEMVVNLHARVENVISLGLYYSCRYFSTHLEDATVTPDLIKGLEYFLSERLLLWMEVMNLKKCMHIGPGIMRQAEKWGRVSSCHGMR
jgi:hypothetical protein